MAQAGDDERVEDGGAATGVGMPDKQPVLFSDRGGPDGVFDQIVVEHGLAVLEVAGERRPLRQQVTAGDAQSGLRSRALAQAHGQRVQPTQAPLLVARAQPRPPRGVAFAPGGVVGLVPLALEPVERKRPGGDRVGEEKGVV